MAITVRQFLQAGSNTATLTAALGAGTAIGDVVFIVHANDFYAAANLTTPTGTGLTFTQQGSTVDGGTNGHHAKWWSTTIQSAGAQTITLNGTTTDEERYYGLWVLQNALATADAVSSGTYGPSAATAVVAPTISPTGTTDLLMGFWMMSGSGSFTSVGAGMTQEGAEIDVAATVTYTSARQTLSASGATGTRTGTYNASSAPWIGMLAAAKEAAAGASLSPEPTMVLQAVTRAAYR